MKITNKKISRKLRREIKKPFIKQVAPKKYVLRTKSSFIRQFKIAKEIVFREDRKLLRALAKY